MMMSMYRELLPSLGGYLTSKTHIHRARVELFLQELARREPLYFEQRAVDEQESAYADAGYRDHYYEVSVFLVCAISVACLLACARVIVVISSVTRYWCLLPLLPFFETD